jgi:hypothetical protein
LLRFAPEVARLDRKRAAGALDHRRIVEQPTDARAVERCRHDQELEILAQTQLHVARERQPEVGVERALMELVEHNGGDARESGIVEDKPGEYALGHDFDPRRPRDFGGETNAVADGRADRLAQGRSHAGGRGPGGESARSEHENLLPCRPGFVREHERHPSGLAGTRWRDHNRSIVRAESAGQLWQHRIDRKRLCMLAHLDTRPTSPCRRNTRARQVHSAAWPVAKSPLKC